MSSSCTHLGNRDLWNKGRKQNTSKASWRSSGKKRTENTCMWFRLVLGAETFETERGGRRTHVELYTFFFEKDESRNRTYDGPAQDLDFQGTNV
jgi:hypothetical protein